MALVNLTPFPSQVVITGSMTTSGEVPEGKLVDNYSAFNPIRVSGIDSNRMVRYLRLDASGSVTIATTGSTGLLVAAPAVSPVWVTGSVGLNPTPVITANTATTGTLGLAVGNAPYAPLYVSVTSSLPVTVQGTVTVTEGSQLSIDNFPATQAVSGTVTVTATSSWHVTVDNSELAVSNFPATQNVSGTIGAVIENWPALFGVSGTVTANVTVTGSAGLAVGNASYQPLFVTVTSSLPVTVQGAVTVTEGSQVSVDNFPSVQAVSGTVSLGNWPSTIGVSSSFPLSVWSAGTVGVSGTVGAVIDNWPAFVGVSGTVGINNFPAVQAVSGSQVTGSTFSGYPVVMGGVSGSAVKALLTDISGAVYVTTTGSLPVAVVGTVPVSIAGTVTVSEGSQFSVNNFPATQAVSGSVTVTSTGSLAVAPGTGVTFPVSIASQLSIDNFPATQSVSGTVTVTATGSWHVTVDNSEISVSNFPATQAVSGTVTSNVTVTGSTGLAVGNAFYAPLYVTVTSSLPVTFAGLPQLSIDNFPATQNVSGTVGAVIDNWPALIGVSGTLGINNFPATQSVSGTVGVNNFPAVQAVSGSQLTGSTFSGYPVVVGGVSGSTVKALFTDVSGAVYITSSGSIAVAPGTGVTFPVSIAGTVTVSEGSQFSVNNFPATQNVSGTVGAVIDNWPSTIGVSSSFPLSVWSAGTVGVSGTVTANVTTTGSIGLLVANPTYAPLYVASTASLAVAPGSGVTFPVSVAAAVTANSTTTGSTGLLVAAASYNPLNVAAAGTAQTGSTAVGSPVAVAGIDGTKIVRALLTDNAGQLWVTGSVLAVNPLTKGTQGATGLSVQNLVDAGRTIKCFTTSSVTGTLGEGLVTLQALSAFALSGAAGTSFVPTNGKTLRLQSMVMTWNSATAASGSVICRLRVSSAGAVTAKSPSVVSLAVNNGLGSSITANVGATTAVDFPDGFEFSGTQQFGLTQQASQGIAGFDVSLIGFEY